MIRFLLDCLLFVAVVVTGVCYCAVVNASRYSRMEEADELEQLQHTEVEL